jgi:hypothetical protein
LSKTRRWTRGEEVIDKKTQLLLYVCSITNLKKTVVLQKQTYS